MPALRGNFAGHRLIEREGWRLVRQREATGSFRHPTKPGVVTSPVIRS